MSSYRDLWLEGKDIVGCSTDFRYESQEEYLGSRQAMYQNNPTREDTYKRVCIDCKHEYRYHYTRNDKKARGCAYIGESVNQTLCTCQGFGIRVD